MKQSRGTGLFFLIISVFFLICACSANKYSDASGGVGRNAAAEYDIQYENQSSASPSARARFGAFDGEAAELEESAVVDEGSAFQSRKLVKRADLRIRVEDLQTTERPLLDLIEKYNAWTASMGIYENSRNYTIRVPSGFYDAMLAELSDLGKLLRRTENAEDVTLRYYDLEARLATKRELLKTYQGYLNKAVNIDEIMTVEYRIADLQQEIDQTGTQFRNLANLVDYSTINVEISGPVSASSYSEPTLGEKLGELFGSFGDVVSSAIIVVIGIIIYGIPAVLIIIFLFWLFFGRVGLIKKLWRLAAAKK